MFGFVIPTCCNSQIHKSQLIRCIDSIRKYYNNVIILINDGNNINDIKLKYKDLYIIESLKKGSADQQVFKIFQDNQLIDKMIYIQDSMILNQKLPNIENIDLQFIWHFTNHRKHWDIIIEPNNKNQTHTEYIIECLDKYYDKNFNLYAKKQLKNKENWCGCFGSCCIISKKYLKKLNENVNFINIFIEFNTNRLRRVNETIFSLICHYTFPNINFENSLDGLYYDGIKNPRNANKLTNFDNLRWCCQNKYISKISFNR